jgi:hypothetical protein
MEPDDVSINEKSAKELNDDFQEAVLPVTVFVGIEVVVAFLGDLLVIYVFLFHYHVCNFRYFVLCMAFVDFTSSLTTMPGEMVTQMYWYIYSYRLACKIKSFLQYIHGYSRSFMSSRHRPRPLQKSVYSFLMADTTKDR